MNAYGIWNTTTQRWATDSEGIIVVFPTLGAAVAQLQETADRMGAHPATIDAEVAEIGEDGRPVEVEESGEHEANAPYRFGMLTITYLCGHTVNFPDDENASPPPADCPICKGADNDQG